MDDTTTKQKQNQNTGVDDVTLNDVLLEEAKMLAETAEYRKEQMSQMKQDLADLKAKHMRPVSASQPTSQAPLPTSPVTPVVPTMQATPPVQNPGYGGQQYNATSQPAAFPTAPVIEQA